MSTASGGAAVIVSVFGAGGAFRWCQAIVVGLVAISLAAHIPSRRTLGRFSPLLAPISIAGLFTAISLIPLPSSVREALDPVGTVLRDDGASLLDLHPWPGLSRDCPSSLRALIFFVTLFAVAVLALRVAASERGRYRLCALVGGACMGAALVTGLHMLVGARKLYGLYTPHATPTILGPLLNENQLGALMALGTCVCTGLVMFRRQRSWIRVVWMCGVVACGALTAASHSRGALLALLAGTVVSGGLLLGQRFAVDQPRRRAGFATSSLPIGIVGICVVVLVVYSSAGSVSAELDRTTLDELAKPRSKFAAWRSSAELIKESPWVGVGRGGFEPSFTRIHPASGAVTFGYVENEYIQSVIDWGVIGGVFLTLAMIWFVGIAARRWRESPLAAGALGGLTAIAVQSNVDFGIELLGLAVPVTVLAATLSYVSVGEGVGRRLAIARAGRVALLAALVLGGLLLLTSHTRSLSEDHELLLRQPTRDLVRSELQRHPLDYFGYGVASEVVRDSSSIQLLNHALRLHPSHPGLHQRAARLLAASGHLDQAAIEYSLAMRSIALPEHMISELLTIFPPPLAAAAIPTDVTNVDQIVNILRDKSHDDVAILWLGRILAIHPRDVHVCNSLYELSLAKGDLAAAELAGKDCLELLPDHQTRMSLAELMLSEKRYSEVVHLLEDVATWRGLVDEKANAWLMLCDARIGMSQWDEAGACIHHLDASGGLSAARHSEISKRIERIHELRAGTDAGSAR